MRCSLARYTHSLRSIIRALTQAPLAQPLTLSCPHSLVHYTYNAHYTHYTDSRTHSLIYHTTLRFTTLHYATP
eukprot:7476916-Lingulodinium_polyedra.AAC.1